TPVTRSRPRQKGFGLRRRAAFQSWATPITCGVARLAFHAEMAAQSTSLPGGVVLRWRGRLSDAEMTDLVASYGGTPVPGWWDTIRPHSFGWVTARTADDVVVGFVNIVTDGGDHALLIGHKDARAAPLRGLTT